MVRLRQFRPDDLDALYHICLLTGASGEDASPLHKDRQLVGHIYAAPYGVIEPKHALVVEDGLGVAGYLVGTHDTRRFAARLEQDWWPALRSRYADPQPGLLPADQQRIEAIRTPEVNPTEIVALYPAHIHMNLLPRLRGQGVGTALVRRWIEDARSAGVTGIHLGANAANTGGIAFWTKSGFVPVLRQGRTEWFGMRLS